MYLSIDFNMIIEFQNIIKLLGILTKLFTLLNPVIPSVMNIKYDIQCQFMRNDHPKRFDGNLIKKNIPV